MDISPQHYHYLKTLLKWKVLSLEGLRKESDYEGNVYSFRKLINRLEKKSYLKSFYRPGRKEKYLVPSMELVKIIAPDQNFHYKEETYYHDAIAANISRSLLNFEKIESVQLRHEFFDQKNFHHYMPIDPDAILVSKSSKENFNIGLEIELHQKSRDRIFHKFESYCKSQYFELAIYFFDKENVYNAYVKRFYEYLNGLNSKKEKEYFSFNIGLSLVPDLARTGVNLEETFLFLNQSQYKFQDIFGQSSYKDHK